MHILERSSRWVVTGLTNNKTHGLIETMQCTATKIYALVLSDVLSGSQCFDKFIKAVPSIRLASGTDETDVIKSSLVSAAHQPFRFCL